MAVGEHSKHFHHLRVFLVYVLLVFFIHLFIYFSYAPSSMDRRCCC
jgi:hypothetical protein